MPILPAQPVPTAGATAAGRSATPAPSDATPHPAAPDAWLVGDIGGTHARFSRLTAQGVPVDHVRFLNDDFDGLAAVLRAALQRTGGCAPRIALAVACPVEDGPVRLTNRDWVFDAASLRRACDAAEVRLVNDFAAAAAGLGALGPHERAAVGRAGPSGRTGGPTARAGTMRVVLGAGTGLGLAATVRCGAGWRVLPSEAGHAGCATAEADAQPALAEARRRWGRASWERLLSGDGLVRLDAGLRGQAARTAAQVAHAAQAGEPAARRAAVAFSRLLGEFAGDACLMLGADSLYLTGGVLDGLGDAFDGGAFRRGFEDKGRFTDRMRAVPAWRVLASDLALRGLAQIVAGGVEAPAAADPPATDDRPASPAPQPTDDPTGQPDAAA